MNDDDYSATALGSQWMSGPTAPADGPTMRADTPTAPADGPTMRADTPTARADGRTMRADGPTMRADVPIASTAPADLPSVAPDRADGSVLRFGPGVTAAAVAPFPVVPAPAPARRRGGARRYALAAAVLAAVLVYLFWQRFGPGIEVRDLTVSTDPSGPACGTAADVVALVRTNGRPGTLTYRWIRSDGTRSEDLTERVARGQQETTLHLLWTFQGPGRYPAEARVELLEPARRTAAVTFTYHCAP
ncbi:hypothetical protein E2C00_17015 [Streptomyces sp. WAC05374]|uniref:hypothetical protein n=1 Tax=Streptomyces sp. WAC05374 TaxID=2487420 RepID=UPI000F88CF28|nr:hypothetical protein [Streptomyces sp. WAC05374]RST09558.1 hypothetical protein EF905_29170 [Streptomyces sp. WAC05374]TDF54623.1 hypothetical protein E2C00_17015 [Streptomyces sp. WAC05374]TDF56258.1 hypothetical protein E2C02_12470 [Streptomyces sp. WAC05374]